MALIQFFNADVGFTLKHKRKLKALLLEVFVLEGKKLGALDYVFCSDDYLHKLNLSFLEHDSFTDIITFDLSERRVRAIKGEIYISVDRVKENANTLQVKIDEELCRVVLHGALHLCGYKDKKNVK
jgi:rRNA maturation RNase YbeY